MGSRNTDKALVVHTAQLGTHLKLQPTFFSQLKLNTGQQLKRLGVKELNGENSPDKLSTHRRKHLLLESFCTQEMGVWSSIVLCPINCMPLKFPDYFDRFPLLVDLGDPNDRNSQI